MEGRRSQMTVDKRLLGANNYQREVKLGFRDLNSIREVKLGFRDQNSIVLGSYGSIEVQIGFV